MPPRATRSSGRAARQVEGAGSAPAAGSALPASAPGSSSGVAQSTSSGSAPAAPSGVAGFQELVDSLPKYGTDPGARAQLVGQIRPASALASSTSGAGFVFGAPFASSSGSASSWEFLELPNSLYLNPSSLSRLSSLLSSIHELDQARQTFSC